MEGFGGVIKAWRLGNGRGARGRDHRAADMYATYHDTWHNPVSIHIWSYRVWINSIRDRCSANVSVPSHLTTETQAMQ